MDGEQRQQITALYLENYDTLMAYARCSLNSEALAEEAVQVTFLVACQKPEDVCHSPNPRGWLMLTLKNTIRRIRLNREMAKKLLERYLASQNIEDFYWEDAPHPRILYENLADREEFQLLVELAVEGCSYQQMASSRGLSISACKKRMQRAKEKLQKIICKK